jgi:hypothetical protein
VIPGRVTPDGREAVVVLDVLGRKANGSRSFERSIARVATVATAVRAE